ncbi:MAG: hypothetical protein LBL80_06470 [Ruminococcus sp.]|jgi:hypothetical protein|nr:hypothetical protein [Ruminococcus sp.]
MDSIIKQIIVSSFGLFSSILIAVIQKQDNKLRKSKILNIAKYLSALVFLLSTILIIISLLQNKEINNDTDVSTTLKGQKTSVTSDISLSDSNISAKLNSSSIIITSDKQVLGNVFAVSYDNSVYYITTFKNLVDAYSSKNTFTLDFDENDKVLSADLSLVSCSPYYNLAVMKTTKDIDVLPYELSETNPSNTTKIIIKGTTLGEQKPIDSVEGDIIDEFGKNSYTEELEILTDARAENMNGAVVLDKDTGKVVGVNSGYTNEGNATIIPVSILKTALNEQSAAFSLDELPENFPYNYYNDIANVENVWFNKYSNTEYQLYNRKDNDRDLSAEIYDDYVWLTDYDDEVAFFRDFNGMSANVTFGKKKALEDSQYNISEDTSIFRQENNIVRVINSDWEVYYDYNEKLFCLHNYTTHESIFNNGKIIQFEAGGKYETFMIDVNKRSENFPDRLVIDNSLPGTYIVSDTVTGITAKINSDGTFEIYSDILFGEYKSDDEITLRKAETDNSNTDNMEVLLYKNDSDEIKVFYTDDPSVYGRVRNYKDYDNIELLFYNSEMYASMMSSGNAAIARVDQKGSVFYSKSKDSIFYGTDFSGGSDFIHGNGIMITPENFIIGRWNNGILDKNSVDPFALTFPANSPGE